MDVLTLAQPLIRSNFVVDELGYDGTNITVAILDSGIDPDHPDFSNKTIIAWKDYVNGIDSPYDDDGHGTHCAGIAVGTGVASNGVYRGVAPGSKT